MKQITNKQKHQIASGIYWSSDIGGLCQGLVLDIQHIFMSAPIKK